MKKKLSQRIIAGALMVLIFLTSLLHPIAFMAVITFAMIVMHLEYFNMSLGKGTYCLEKALSIIASLCLFYVAFSILAFSLEIKWLYICVLPFLALNIAIVLNKDERGSHSYAEHFIFPIVYIGASSTISSLLLFNSQGNFSPLLFISIFVMIWMSDIGAYVLGMTFGQKENSKKLCPNISPKKSWCGVWGDLLFTLLAAFALQYFGMVNFPYIHLVVISLIVVVFGIFGDLFESLIKRRYSIKDSGTIMPGHGGLLDRFDGALFVLPAVFVYIKLFTI
ncbi:MAG: phosphatidate cytidylyltransferase [Bacteroidales bacterium]|nr:phosphatidate cytidylyltransferase [Bacteroidales bacterium]